MQLVLISLQELPCHGEVESDEYCQEVLRARIKDQIFDSSAQIWGDVRTFKPKGPATSAEALVAGFPCQASHSAARKMAVVNQKLIVI